MFFLFDSDSGMIRTFSHSDGVGCLRTQTNQRSCVRLESRTLKRSSSTQEAIAFFLGETTPPGELSAKRRA